MRHRFNNSWNKNKNILSRGAAAAIRGVGAIFTHI
jgi:hypothetical protein